jgi:hypothetical protein
VEEQTVIKTRHLLSKRDTWRDFGFLNGKSELLTGAEPETCNRLSTQRRKGAKE